MNDNKLNLAIKLLILKRILTILHVITTILAIPCIAIGLIWYTPLFMAGGMMVSVAYIFLDIVQAWVDEGIFPWL